MCNNSLAELAGLESLTKKKKEPKENKRNNLLHSASKAVNLVWGPAGPEKADS